MKVGSLSRLRLQIAAHRHALGVTRLHPVFLIQHVGLEIPAAEEAHLDADAAGAKGLLAFHGGKDRLPRILFRPHATEAGRAEQAHIQARLFLAAQALLGRGV